MNKNILNSPSVKYFLLVLLYLILFYFLIFKNILILNEKKEMLISNDIRLERLKLENKTLETSLSSLQEKFLLEKNKFEEKNKNVDGKSEFEDIAQALDYINSGLEKNNILLNTIGRSKKDGENFKVSFSFFGDEVDFFNFFKELENDKYFISFSNSPFLIASDERGLIFKGSLFSKISNLNAEKIDNLNLINYREIFSKATQNKRYMKIGNKNFYPRQKIETEKEKESKNTKNEKNSHKEEEEK